jgi:hypothetical protein
MCAEEHKHSKRRGIQKKIFLCQPRINWEAGETMSDQTPEKKSSQGAELSQKRKQICALWACPICLKELGIDDGVVPCALTSCRPVLHLVCFDCSASLKKVDCTKVECPLCKRASEVVPIVDFVAPGDEEAAAKAAKITYSGEGAVDNINQLVEASRKAAAGQSSAHAERIAQRVQFVVDKVQQAIDNGYVAQHGVAGFTWCSTDVPPFDQDAVSLTCKGPFKGMTRVLVLDRLRSIAREIDAHIKAIYSDSPYIVTTDIEQGVWPKRRQPGSSLRPVYLRFSMKPRPSRA